MMDLVNLNNRHHGYCIISSKFEKHFRLLTILYTYTSTLLCTHFINILKIPELRICARHPSTDKLFHSIVESEIVDKGANFIGHIGMRFIMTLLYGEINKIGLV